jgi:ADP-L-glycero-D-manno-heptose 6-epimerase
LQSVEFTDLPDNLQGNYRYDTRAETAKLRAAGFDKPSTTREKGLALHVHPSLETAGRCL